MQKPKSNISKLPPETGAVINLQGQKVAAYKSEAGKLTIFSPVCTHLGCLVVWNNQDKTWDCPCHGSRFSKTGNVIKGPATKGLSQLDIK